MLSGVRSTARRKLFRADPADLLGVANWPEAGGAGHQQRYWSAALEHDFMLESTDDEYGGVVVDADRLPADKAAFARSLAASLSYWNSVIDMSGGEKAASVSPATSRDSSFWVTH
ncbi:nudix hydrolase 8-like [Panicum miliaceum]|uniref:Nudix hydrolase 8-like n=1 Tax=Panicum miliaceum TaxID=4540 RepID=A0A3L6PZL9_PANMI|nr:nudix hydrolase 8-like [Panicum miliaceum]